ncbi:MAG: hypothetical protein QOJ21_547 [Solirubrobacteraceae bacterium]|jgi:hypothetical protein|nr:hypothetical protein [Solirubrobacteraceae bacterium]
MSRASTLLGVLTHEPVSTSALYDRVGYATLVSLGLVPYDAFRTELAKLAKAGLAASGMDDDGATTWRLPAPAEEDGDSHGAGPDRAAG